MSKKRKPFSPEFRAEAVRMVIEGPRPVAEVARELGVNETTLSNWVTKHRKENPEQEEPLSVADQARLRELEQENRGLKMENEFLKKGVPRTWEIA